MKISKEDILKVVSELGQHLTDDEVTQLLNEYQENDLDPWFIIVEDLMYNIIDERK